MAHSTNLTAVEYVDDTYANESMARRLIAKDLKIVSGTITLAASTYTVSGGEVFDYTLYGSRFLWMGLTCKVLATPTASAEECSYLATYDPNSMKIQILVCGGDATRLEQMNPGVNTSDTIVIHFVLFVFEGGASVGAGLG